MHTVTIRNSSTPFVMTRLSSLLCFDKVNPIVFSNAHLNHTLLCTDAATLFDLSFVIAPRVSSRYSCL